MIYSKSHESIGWGYDVYQNLENKGKSLTRKIKPLLARYATDSRGNFYRIWKEMPSGQRAELVQMTQESENWLLRFEDGWATEWILKKMIDQRVYDHRRTKGREIRRQEKLSRDQSNYYYKMIIISNY